MPRLLPLLAFLGCALRVIAAPDSPPSIPPSAPSAPPATVAAAEPAAPVPAVPPRVSVESAPAPAPIKTDGPAYSPVEKFDRAVVAYEAGKYDEARQAFISLVEEGHLSAALAHNLGNIEYKTGNDGQASLWYRRALAMQPISPETLQNMRFLHKKTGFQTWDNAGGFVGLSISHFAFVPAAGITVICGWAAIILLAWLLWWTPRPGLRWPLITLFVLLLPVTALSGSLWWLLENDPHPLAKRYILTSPEASAYAAPAEASSDVIRLPTGSEVMPLETRGNWFYCEIPSGRSLSSEDEGVVRGWVRASLLEPLWPWPASPRG